MNFQIHSGSIATAHRKKQSGILHHTTYNNKGFLLLLKLFLKAS